MILFMICEEAVYTLANLGWTRKVEISKLRNDTVAWLDDLHLVPALLLTDC